MKNIPQKKSERGSAILMTLGILAMVMTLGMLFVATSGNSKTIAKAGADDNRAAMTSESAEAFALAILQEMSQTSTTYRPEDQPAVKYNSGNGNHQPYVGNYLGNSGILGHITLSSANWSQNAIATKPSADYTATDMANESNRLWTAVKNGSTFAKLAQESVFSNLDDNAVGYQNVENGSGEIIGRYGFIVLADGSKFNLNAIVNPLVGNGVSNSIPEVAADGNGVTLNGEGGYVDMPLGMSSSPDDEQNTGSFLVMGFNDDVTDDYEDTIVEDKTLRYGLHPQEIRAVSILYATPDGNAPKWNSYLQLSEVTDFQADDMLLYNFAGGNDEREMVFNGVDDIDADDLTAIPTNAEKINLQLPDMQCGDNDKIGWEAVSQHFRFGNSPACITHEDSCPWRTNVLLQNKVIGHGNSDSKAEFQDEDGNNINSHIMANMVDFCDNDDFVTYCFKKGTSIKYPIEDGMLSDADLDSDLAADQDNIICGNEMAPAVTGVNFEVSMDEGIIQNMITEEYAEGNPIPTSYYTWSVTTNPKLILKPTISLANIYDQYEMSGDHGKFECQVVVSGDVKWEFDPVTAGTESPVKSGAEMSLTDFSRPFYGFNATPCAIVGPDALDNIDVSVDDIEIELTDVPNAEYVGQLTKASFTVSVRNVLVLLHPVDNDGYAAALSDIAFFHNETESTESSEVAIAAATTAGSNTMLKAFCAKDGVGTWNGYATVNDPRCNDRALDWNTDNLTISQVTKPTSLAQIAWTNIAANCKINDGTEKDWEPDLDSTGASGFNTFSTAYIANEPFTSLWQLGAIHRYEVGRTINLRKYNTGSDGPAIGKYEDGDAALLDFYKLTEANNGILGKFNPNCFNEGAYKYLLENTPFASDVNDVSIYRPNVNYYNDTVAPADVTNFVNFETSLSDEDTYKLQSWLPMEAFMNFCTPVDGSGSDREIEAFFGCAAGLLSTRYETFTIITIGQTLNYMEGLGNETGGENLTDVDDVEDLGGINPITIDGKWYSTLGTRIQAVTVIRDCWLNTCKVVGRRRL